MHTLHTTYYMHTCVLRAQLVSNSIHNLHNIHTSYYYSISSMYSSYSSGWDDRELAKEAGSRWSITQQQLYNSQQYQQYYYYSRVVGVRVVVLLVVYIQECSIKCKLKPKLSETKTKRKQRIFPTDTHPTGSKTMCSDLGQGSRICAFYSFTGVLFTVSCQLTLRGAK